MWEYARLSSHEPEVSCCRPNILFICTNLRLVRAWKLVPQLVRFKSEFEQGDAHRIYSTWYDTVLNWRYEYSHRLTKVVLVLTPITICNMYLIAFTFLCNYEKGNASCSNVIKGYSVFSPLSIREARSTTGLTFFCVSKSKSSPPQATNPNRSQSISGPLFRELWLLLALSY